MAMKAAGAEHSHEDGLTLLTCTLGDKAQNIFEEHLRSFPDSSDADPVLSVCFCPPPDVDVKDLPTALWPSINSEARSILGQYRGLRAADFRLGLVPLRTVAEVGSLPTDLRFQHASMSGARVMSRIATPRDAVSCPAISSLSSGTYLCTIKALWVGTCENTHVFRVVEEKEKVSI